MFIGMPIRKRKIFESNESSHWNSGSVDKKYDFPGSDKEYKCGNCKWLVKYWSKFCSSCWYSLLWQIDYKCNSCKSDVKKWDNFCSNCWKELKWGNLL